MVPTPWCRSISSQSEEREKVGGEIGGRLVGYCWRRCDDDEVRGDRGDD